MCLLKCPYFGTLKVLIYVDIWAFLEGDIILQQFLQHVQLIYAYMLV